MVKRIAYISLFVILSGCSPKKADEQIVQKDQRKEVSLEKLVVLQEDGEERSFAYDKDQLYCYVPAASPAYNLFVKIVNDAALQPILMEHNVSFLVREKDLTNTPEAPSTYASSGRSSKMAVEKNQLTQEEALQMNFPGTVYTVKGADSWSTNQSLSIYDDTTGHFVSLYDWAIENTDIDRAKLDRLFAL